MNLHIAQPGRPLGEVIQPKLQSRTGSRGIAVQPCCRLKLGSRTDGSGIAHEAALTSACDFAPGRDPSFLITKPLIGKTARSGLADCDDGPIIPPIGVVADGGPGSRGRSAAFTS